MLFVLGFWSDYANHPAPPTALSSIEGVVPERLQVTVLDVVADVAAVAVDAASSVAAGPPATRLTTLVLRRARLASAVAQTLNRGVSLGIRTHDPLTPLKGCAILL